MTLRKPQPPPTFNQIWTNGKERIAGGKDARRYYLVVGVAPLGVHVAACNIHGAMHRHGANGKPPRKLTIKPQRFDGRQHTGHYRFVAMSSFEALTWTDEPRYA